VPLDEEIPLERGHRGTCLAVVAFVTYFLPYFLACVAYVRCVGWKPRFRIVGSFVSEYLH